MRRKAPAQGWLPHGPNAETPAEARVRQALTEAGLPFRQSVLLGGGEVDFLVDEAVVVEVDGWTHMGTSARERDRRKEEHLAAAGYDVLRIRNSEARDSRLLARFIRQVQEAVLARRTRIARAGGEPLATRLDSPGLRALRASLAAREKSAQAEPRPPSSAPGGPPPSGGESRLQPQVPAALAAGGTRHGGTKRASRPGPAKPGKRP